MTANHSTNQVWDAGQAADAVRSDGYARCGGALELDVVDHLRDEVARVFADARARDGGAVPRGPERWYVEVHPEAIDGFVEIAAHPWVASVAEAVLGPDYRIVEFGFDIPFPGAQLQPWHRDFPMPSETRDDRRLTSLAVNIPLVSITEQMGRFEIVPGTQYDPDDDFDGQQFPPAWRAEGYAARSVELDMAAGDISARSALAIHRGRPNRSDRWRPMLVIGFDDPTANNSAHHDLAMSRSFWDDLPIELRSHFDCPIEDELPPLVQHHLIDGLLDPASGD
ncbi:MAG: phytanoyl-CoA dioxygenase family protein [Actinomycetota bacterium]